MASKQNTPPAEVMVVNDSPGEECRIAILEDNHLEELYAERVATATKVGNIYKGRVVNVEPAIQAAFIDYGEGINGFLHISDLHPRYFPGAERVERVGRKIPRRERPPIQEALKRGQEVLVQVLKEGLGTKGPTLTSYLSIPGRLLVVMPDMDRVGVSRKVEDDEGRREMRKILDSLDLPDGFGFILRTAGVGRNKTELKRDVAYLMRLWKVMEKRIDRVGAPCELYTESDLLIRTVRDVLRPSISAIVVDSASAFDRVSAFLGVVAPRSAPKLVRYRRTAPIFHAFDIERQIELIHSREVPLASGGQLVIDQTEALVAIDVNSGKSRAARDSETNAYQTNCEAVDEICRQLRLRDLGGLIIHDLIDMRSQKNRRLIEERFQNNLKRDRARSTILRISEFGLVEMTRQRMRPSMRKSHFIRCPQCDGHGEIKSPESVAADVARQVGFMLDNDRVRRLQIVCSPRVASVLLSRKRRELVRLEDSSGKMIDVRVSDDIAQDRVDYYAYDDRNADIDVTHLPAISLPTLEELEAEIDEPSESATPADGPSGRRGSRSRRRRRRGGPADATAIALAGGFDDDDDDDDDEEGQEQEVEAADRPESAEIESDDATPRKRRRRRRRRKGSAGEEAVEPGSREADEPIDAESDAAADATAAEAPAESIRVFALAKELGVTSRQIIDRCGVEQTVSVKNHMSSLNGTDAQLVRGWFLPEPPEPPELSEPPAPSADGTDEAAPRRRRRRRGGRRRGGRGSGDAERTDSDEKSDASAADEPDERTNERMKDRSDALAVEEARNRVNDRSGEPANEPAASSGDGAPPARKRRRRGRRGRGGKASEAQTPEMAETSAGPMAAVEEAEPTADGGAERTDPGDGKPIAREDRIRKSRREPSSVTDPKPRATSAESADGAAEPAKPAKPVKRRALYANRRKVTVATREATEPAE